MANAFAVWMTGLPACGKSTITRALVGELKTLGIDVAVLESDALRPVLTPHATYGDDEREQFYRVMTYIGTLLVSHGVPVIFDATANRRAYRAGARSKIDRLVEVYVDCPLGVCKARDPKGIYRKGQAGDSATVPGLQTPYEAPDHPDLVVSGDRAPAETSAHAIVEVLEAKGYLGDVMARDAQSEQTTTAVGVPIGNRRLQGDLGMPVGAHGIVLFAHGSGSSRHSVRNQFVARTLERRGLATLLIDLLTPAEEVIDEQTAEHRFDIRMLADRLTAIIDWLRLQKETSSLPIGLFGASTGGGAALMAAAARPRDVAAIVSRGGRPDLARSALPRVTAPTLLIVSGLDTPVIQLNRDAMRQMLSEAVLEIVPGATHLFEERGTLSRVAELAGEWFERYLQRPA